MTALASASSNCKRQIRPLVRDASRQQSRNCPTVTKTGLGPQMGLDTKTGRLTVGRNITSTLVAGAERE
jgi:hypothetical protein